MKLLFICSRNRLRSPTAEAVFSQYAGIETLSAGTNPDADNPVSSDQIEWADIIFAMENTHRRKLNGMFGPLLKMKKIAVLDIPDRYEYMDERLIEILKMKVSRHIDVQK